MENQFKVTKQEAFEMGRLEGIKEAFSEIQKLQTNDVRYLNAYIDARLKSVTDNVIFISKFRGGTK